MSVAAEVNPPRITAPWSAATVAALNQYQIAGRMHPFTCGEGARGEHISGMRLIATENGWYCPVERCPYTQDWAWSWMAAESDVS